MIKMLQVKKFEKRQRRKVTKLKCRKCGNDDFIKIVNFLKIDEFVTEDGSRPKIICEKCKTSLSNDIVTKLINTNPDDLFENIIFVSSYLLEYGSRKDKYAKGLVDFLYRVGELPCKKAKKILKSSIGNHFKMWPFTEADKKFDNISHGTILAICNWIISEKLKQIKNATS